MKARIKKLKKDEFRKKLKESIQQSKESKGRIISTNELDEIMNSRTFPPAQN